MKDKNGNLGFEWDPDNAYDQNGNLKDGYYKSAITFQDNGNWTIGTWDVKRQRHISHNVGTATVTVYYIDKWNCPQTETFKGTTMPSDPNYYATIKPGQYVAVYHKHHGKYKALQLRTLNNFSTSIPTVGVNPSNPKAGSSAAGVNIHMAGKGNFTGTLWTKSSETFKYNGKVYHSNFSRYSGVSEACLTMDVTTWANFINLFPDEQITWKKGKIYQTYNCRSCTEQKQLYLTCFTKTPKP